MTDDISNEKTVIKKDGVRSGARIGRYTLGRRLGIGGMAEVFVAEQDGPQQFKKRVVIKRILPALAADPQFVQMFVREAQVAARLAHANIVQILELGEHTEGSQTEYFIAMEHIDGLTLQRLAQTAWDEGKAVPVDVVLRACADAARGLHAAHSLKDDSGAPTPLVHRDVSPDNLMVSRDGVTKVLDFGIAKGDIGGPKTKTGNVRGKIPYMSPEQVTGKTLDSTSDLFSLGVSIYYLLCGERPFDRGTDYHTMQALLHEAPKPLRAVNPAVPDALEALVLRLLEKDPHKRPTSAEAVADELEALTQPGTGAGRKTTIAFVAHVIEKTDAAGNPLSEADGARATVPIESAVPAIDASAIVVAESVVPRQVTLPAEQGAPEVATEAATPALASAERAIENEASTSPPPVATATAEAPPEPPSVPATSSPPPAARAEVSAGADTSHPVVDMLTPRREGLPPTLVLAFVIVGMGAVGAPLAYFGIKAAQHRADALPEAVDAGEPRVKIADAGIAAPPPVADAGGLAVAAVDAGATSLVLDAGVASSPPIVVDAGVARTPAVVDAGVARAPAPPDAGVAAPKPIRLAVRATAPSGIRWELPSGTPVGSGSTTLFLARGTKELVAHDPARQRTDTLAIALDGDLKGSVDYTPLLTATLVVTNAGDARVMLGIDDVAKTGRALAVPGTYNVRIFVGEERTLARVVLKKGETTTLDVQKAIAKKK